MDRKTLDLAAEKVGHTHPNATPTAAGDEAKPMTVEQILHRVDTHVGGVSPKYPLDNSDWINFARAIEAHHGIVASTEAGKVGG
jgi:hypothetical protein